MDLKWEDTVELRDSGGEGEAILVLLFENYRQRERERVMKKTTK